MRVLMALLFTWLVIMFFPNFIFGIIGADVEDPESPILPTRPFIFVSLLGPHTGGIPALSKTFYVDQIGCVQVAKESSDGKLYYLRHGHMETASLFQALDSVKDAIKSGVQRHLNRGNELPEYFPPRVVLAYETPFAEYLIASFHRQDTPKDVQELLVQKIVALQDRELKSAKQGIFIRAQRLPHFDPRIQNIDLIVNLNQAASADDLWLALQREMAWVRVGNLDQNILLAGRLAVEPGRSFHVQVGNVVYRIYSFAFKNHLNG